MAVYFATDFDKPLGPEELRRAGPDNVGPAAPVRVFSSLAVKDLFNIKTMLSREKPDGRWR
jgi:hypothetical protein